MTIPVEWMPKASMQRIIVHWTAGGHRAGALDRAHYHLIVEGDGNLVRGDLPITANAAPIRSNYAAHTLNCNSGSIGVSLACMDGAVESPFKPGDAPMTREQWEAGLDIVADLCRRYAIVPSPKTVLTHAEVEKNLAIKQRGKWDIARLAFEPSVFGATVIGDLLRAKVAARLERPAAPSTEAPVRPEPMRLVGIVTAPTLNLRRAPSASADLVGALPRGVRVDILDEDEGWYEVRTPAGYEGFVSARYVALA